MKTDTGKSQETDEIHVLMNEIEKRSDDLKTMDPESLKLVSCFLREIIRLLDLPKQSS